MKLVRDHHKVIMSVLENFNTDIMRSTECYFGGGTAIALMIDEYRTSVDIDFLCSSRDGYSELRELVHQKGIEGLFITDPPVQLRSTRVDKDGIRTVFEVEDQAIKFEIISEGRIDLEGEESDLPLPTLSKECLFVEKLMANADRGMDKSGLSKDFLDLIMMQHKWGAIPDNALLTARKAYQSAVADYYEKVFYLLARDKTHLAYCFDRLNIHEKEIKIISDYFMDQDHASYVRRRLKQIDPTHAI
jgi:hypothetical protein